MSIGERAPSLSSSRFLEGTTFQNRLQHFCFSRLFAPVRGWPGSDWCWGCWNGTGPHLQGSKGAVGASQPRYLGRAGAGRLRCGRAPGRSLWTEQDGATAFPSWPESRRLRAEGPGTPAGNKGAAWIAQRRLLWVGVLFPPDAEWVAPGFRCQVAPNPRRPGLLSTERWGDHAAPRNREST